MVLDDLGLVDSAQSRLEESRKESEEALKIYRVLAQRQPETYLPHVAITLNNLGIFDSDRKRMKEARREYEEALKLYRQLAEKEPATFLPLPSGDAQQPGNSGSRTKPAGGGPEGIRGGTQNLRRLGEARPRTVLAPCKPGEEAT
jgi:tetratricopeptide (TPR) repeat protein